MSAPAARLREELPELIARLERFACVEPRLVPPLVEYLRESLAADDSRLKALADANAERSKAVRAAIRKAADKLLQEPVRRTQPRRMQSGMLWQWLGVSQRYLLYGLDGRPCRRVVREALKEWTPPNGDSVPTR